MTHTPLQHPETAVLAFRGYNYTNLGRSFEFLNHSCFGEFYRNRLTQCSNICSEVLAIPIDLVQRVSQQQDTTLETYSEAVGLIMAVEMAQCDILEQVFDLKLNQLQMMMGYSLGELTALVASGSLSLEEALAIPLNLSNDCASLANDCQLAVIFCLKQPLPYALVSRCCQLVNSEGQGLIGISSILSPNSLIVIGERDTTERFRIRLAEHIESKIFVKPNEHQWPPLHTPITWRQNVPSRAALMMSQMQSGFASPCPPVLSLVTGKCSYNDHNLRETIYAWVDHPQNLWEAVYTTLKSGTQTIIHVGPAPNIIPATYQRLAANVEIQTRGSFQKRTLATFVNRPWLKAILPENVALLRAPQVKQIILEDWLLDEAKIT